MEREGKEEEEEEAVDSAFNLIRLISSN